MKTFSKQVFPAYDTQADLRQSLSDGIHSLGRFLLERQAREGYWCFELECDITPTADYIILRHFLENRRQEPAQLARDPRLAKAAQRILSQQNPDGSWALYHGGPGEISATVKAYFALKLAGYAPSDNRLERAAQFIAGHGGVAATNSFLKFYLALFGQWPWNQVPAMSPELIFLPKRFPFHIHAMSSWSRAIVIPMFILYALRPKIVIPEALGIGELLGSSKSLRAERSNLARTMGLLRRTRAAAQVPPPRNDFDIVAGHSRRDPWSIFFQRVDILLKALEKLPWKPFRAKAISRCRDWIVERLPKSQGLGSIWPAMINAVMALHCLEFPRKQELLAQSLREVEALILEDDQGLRVQPCFSAVWDTAIAILALRYAGLPADDSRLLRAGQWLLSKEVRIAGDWVAGNPAGQPGGWYFQFANDFYPDTDDTAMVLLALEKLGPLSGKDAVMDRAVRWLLSMQNPDGGWGAFDKGNHREYLTKVPFADHNAMIDPSSCDVTGRVMEALGTLRRAEEAVARRAFGYLRRSQDPDGTWFGRWGVNYIYGTWSVSNAWRVWGRQASRVQLDATLDWLRARQNSDGGWGESCASYDDAKVKGLGPSTASQTAWALNVFFNAGVADDAAVTAGISYLLRKIAPDGSVNEPEFTGTGFPRVFYLNYHLYRIAFPLIALSRYRDYLPPHPEPLPLSRTLGGWGEGPQTPFKGEREG